MSGNVRSPAGDGGQQFLMDNSPIAVWPTQDGRFTTTYEGEVELDGEPLIIAQYSKTAEFETRAKAVGWLLEMDQLRSETVFIHTEGQVTYFQFRCEAKRWIGEVKRFYQKFGKELVPCDIRMTVNQLEAGVLNKRGDELTKFGPDVGADYHGATPPTWA